MRSINGRGIGEEEVVPNLLPEPENKIKSVYYCGRCHIIVACFSRDVPLLGRSREQYIAPQLTFETVH